MKVILLEDIKGVGKKEEIIDVKQGYAENFLFPQKKAVLANTSNLNKLKQEKKERQNKKEAVKENSIKIKEKLEKLNLVIEAKVGDMDKLFGTITSKEIAETLEKKEKIKIDRRKIEISDPIKRTGAYIVDVKLSEGVTSKLRVLVKRI